MQLGVVHILRQQIFENFYPLLLPHVSTCLLEDPPMCWRQILLKMRNMM